MEKFKVKYSIPSNREEFWDQSKPGDYFVIIHFANRERIVGNVVDGKMVLPDICKIVESECMVLI